MGGESEKVRAGEVVDARRARASRVTAWTVRVLFGQRCAVAGWR